MIHHSHTGPAGIALLDSLLTGLKPQTDVRLATTAALPAGTYANGTAGVGATFSVTATGTLTVDGVLTALGDRLLVKNQATAFQNGVYTLTTAGAAGVAAVLTRDVGSDQSAEVQGQTVVADAGTANTGKGYVNINTAAPTMGTTGIYFASLRMVHSQKTDALPQVLADAATVLFDAGQGVNGTLLIGGNRTLGFPSNLFPGASGRLWVTQDGTGSRTLAYASGYKWAGGSAGTLSTAANSVDRLDWNTPDGVTVEITLTKAYA